MTKLLQFLFVIQHDYRDAAQETRARILLPLISLMAILVTNFGVYLTVSSLVGISDPSDAIEYSTVVIPLLIAWMAGAVWLTQRGHLQIATAMITLFLTLIAVNSLATNGITPGAVMTVPLLLTFIGLAYGSWGTILILLLSWIGLPLIARLQADGALVAAEAPYDDLLREALLSAQMLTLTALLLWLFTWNLQRTLNRATRIAAQTRATASTGQAIARILNMEELLASAVDLIRDRFAYYHVQMFLLDDAGEHANLAASTGNIGQRLLAQGFRIPVGSHTIVGEAADTGTVQTVADITQTNYQHPDQLPNTRAELALPLIIGEDVTGILDIQSTRANAFGEEDIEAMRIIANQVTQALNNARLFEAQQRSLLQNRRLFIESETNLREIERLNRQLTAHSWQEYMLERSADRLSIRLIGDQLDTGVSEWTPIMKQAYDRQRTMSKKDNGVHTLAVPITIRGETIGVVEVKLSSDQNPTEARNMLQAVIDRMAFSLENARLFEQAHLSAEREQQINQVSAQLQGMTNIDDVLMTAVQTLGEVLQAESGTIRLAGRDTIAAVAESPVDKRRTQPISRPADLDSTTTARNTAQDEE
ncbi:MAG: GAF domain-containing protein [Anaerolineae bacterium]|nr:GAF domain-containing protein [Anaerolineae bacterium]